MTIFSGFWLPAAAPMIDGEVHINATKPLKISDDKWQLSLALNGIITISNCDLTFEIGRIENIIETSDFLCT